MDVKEAILKRRSVRKYQDKDIPSNIITEIIDAARLAPSGHNAQPGRYFIVNDSETRNRLKKENVFYQNFVYSAPVIIVCCADSTAYGKESSQDDPNEQRALGDLCIASSFLVLRATELGLGTCYIGWVDKEKIKKVLKIHEKFIVPFVIAVGYPAESPKVTPRKSVEEITLKP